MGFVRCTTVPLRHRSHERRATAAVCRYCTHTLAACPTAMAFALNRAALARPLRASAPKRTPARVPARPVRAGSGDLDRVAAIEDEISRQRAQIAAQREAVALQRQALETVQTGA